MAHGKSHPGPSEGFNAEDAEFAAEFAENFLFLDLGAGYAVFT
jgi:hypothetical protein